MNHINSNIRYLRKKEGKTQQEFATDLGIKRSLLGAYEEGRAKPKLEVQLTITRLFGISLDRLVREDLSIVAPRIQKKKSTRQKAHKSGPTKILTIAVNDKEEEQIVLVGQKARAGYLSGYGDTEYVGELPRFNLPFLPTGTYRAFEITGDSMLPVQPGAVVVGEYVDNWTELHDGQTYILLTQNDGIVYKRVFSHSGQNGHLTLQSDNPSYPPYELALIDVHEIWEARILISRLSRKKDESVDRMMQMLGKVQQKLDKKDNMRN